MPEARNRRKITFITAPVQPKADVLPRGPSPPSDVTTREDASKLPPNALIVPSRRFINHLSSLAPKTKKCAHKPGTVPVDVVHPVQSANRGRQ